MENSMIVKSPLVIMFENDQGGVTCHIHPAKNYKYQDYGLLICDLVRHVAKAYKVNESKVWEWVDKERYNPTTEIQQAS
jgi:hypothetical protein